MTLNFILNGRPTELEVSPDKRLLDLLRDRSRPLKARLRDFLLITGEAQQLFDSENMAELAAFCTGSLAISAETDAGSGSWEAAACRCSSTTTWAPAAMRWTNTTRTALRWGSSATH